MERSAQIQIMLHPTRHFASPLLEGSSSLDTLSNRPERTTGSCAVGLEDGAPVYSPGRRRTFQHMRVKSETLRHCQPQGDLSAEPSTIPVGNTHLEIVTPRVPAELQIVDENFVYSQLGAHQWRSVRSPRIISFYMGHALPLPSWRFSCSTVFRPMLRECFTRFAEGAPHNAPAAVSPRENRCEPRQEPPCEPGRNPRSEPPRFTSVSRMLPDPTAALFQFPRVRAIRRRFGNVAVLIHRTIASVRPQQCADWCAP